jgi:hypothetical protein
MGKVMNKYLLLKRKRIVLIVVGTILCLSTLIAWFAFIGGSERTMLVKRDEKVIAYTMYIETETTQERDGEGHAYRTIIQGYYLRYSYIDEIGREYTGRAKVEAGKNYYKSKDEARTHLGEEVLIYIDGKGKASDMVGDGSYPDNRVQLIWAICLSATTTVYLVFAWLLCLYMLKKVPREDLLQQVIKDTCG